MEVYFAHVPYTVLEGWTADMKKGKVSSSRSKKPVKKQRPLLWLAAAAVLVCAAVVWRHFSVPQIELPYLTSRYVAVMDVDTGRFVYKQDIDTPRSPASLTKLMTLFLVLDDLESGALSWEDTFTVTPEQAHTQGSKYGMTPGEVFTVRQLVAGTVLSSGCDCVQCLVLMCAQDELDFVARMNEKAKELGMKGSNFANATGIDASGHYMTARDIAVLSRELIRAHPELLDFTSVPKLTVEDREFKNMHRLVGRDERVVGLKTGTTLIGGYNLVTLAREDGREYIIVLLDSNNDNSRFSEAKTVVDVLFGEGQNGQK